MSAIDEVQQGDDARISALLNGDVAALEKLLHPDVMYTHASGLLDDKQSYLAPLIAGKIKYRSAKREELRIQVHGDIALLIGKSNQVVSLDGVDTPFLIRYSTTWIKSAGSWQMIMWHASKVS